jgi:hypothetical protein
VKKVSKKRAALLLQHAKFLKKMGLTEKTVCKSKPSNMPAFFDPVSIKDRNFFMNHLSYLPKKHKAMIPSSALAYSLDEPYTSKPMPISDFQKDWRFHCRVGVYIPASSLSLIKVE